VGTAALTEEDRVTSLNEIWRKSSRSNNNGACVEVRRIADAVQIRDTKDRTGPMLSFPANAWHGFVAGVHNGEFDRV
jgi:hypothetical protein